MIQKNKYSNVLKSIAAIFLLVGYLSAFLGTELHHLFEHNHSIDESCSVESEKDPCHRLVFHHDSKVKCDHDGHFLATKHKCDLCDAIVSHFYFPEVNVFQLAVQQGFKSILTFEEKIIIRFSDPSISLRGPPTTIFFS